MAVRPAGVLRLGRRAFGPSRLLVMATVDPAGDPAAAMQRVHAAVAHGADIVGVAARTGGVASFVAGVRDRYPELAVGVAGGADGEVVAREAGAAGADLLSWGGADPLGPSGPSGPVGSWDLRLAEVAAEFGAGVICPPDLATRAAAAGVEPERVVIGVRDAVGLAAAVATGWPVLVSLSGDDLAGSLATAAVSAWLGARVFQLPWTVQARRALRMISAIRGDIPPARAVRGLG